MKKSNKNTYNILTELNTVTSFRIMAETEEEALEYIKFMGGTPIGVLPNNYEPEIGEEVQNETSTQSENISTTNVSER